MARKVILVMEDGKTIHMNETETHRLSTPKPPVYSHFTGWGKTSIFRRFKSDETCISVVVWEGKEEKVR